MDPIGHDLCAWGFAAGYMKKTLKKASGLGVHTRSVPDDGDRGNARGIVTGRVHVWIAHDQVTIDRQR